jgi:hypothetical protein
MRAMRRMMLLRLASFSEALGPSAASLLGMIQRRVCRDVMNMISVRAPGFTCMAGQRIEFGLRPFCSPPSEPDLIPRSRP